MKKMRLKTTLSLIFALIAAITVFLVSVFSGLFINRQFEEYVKQSQIEEAAELAESIGSNFDEKHGGFNIDYVHGMGMYALKEGYILKLYDENKNLLWDAENHDMEFCHEIMDGIMSRMQQKMPELKGDFVTYSYDLTNAGKKRGVLEISYFMPYYLNENDFHFLQALNMILWIVGAIAVVASAFLGTFIAKRITNPISGVISATKKISEGDYEVRVDTDLKEQETYELAEAINGMAYALREQEYLRKQMTEDIAHELRTPVTNISSYVEMMVEGVMEPTKERLSSCYDELFRLSLLIKDLELLESAEPDNVALEKEDVDLYGLSKSIFEGFSNQFREKGIDAKIMGYEAHVVADRKRIGQVITNLLSNAIKYTDEKGSISVLVKRDTNKAVLIVEDTGIGIPKEDLGRVFERFYRTDKSRTRKTGGAGIGLSISKAIVKAHGGVIYCKSEPGTGSRFIVELPTKASRNLLFP